MAEKTLGVDIGERNLKAVLVLRGMRSGFSVAEVLTVNISEAGGLPAAIEKLREKMDLAHVRVNLSLPSRLVSFHNIKLPFREEKKIKQTIAYELETMLPHGINGYFLHFHVVNQDKHSEILAAVAPRSVLKERMSLFGDNASAISVIGIDALPVASRLLANRAFASSGLLIDVGSRDTVAVFVQDSKIVRVRHYAFGGDFLSPAFDAEKGSLPESGSVNEVNPPGEFDAWGEACRSFCRDLENTIEIVKWGGGMEDGPARVFLTGGGTCDHRFREELSRYLSCPIETADVAAMDEALLPDEIRATWQPALMNQALALAMDGYKKGQGISFSPQEAETKAGREEFGRALRWGTAVFTLAAFLLIMDAYMDYRYARLRLDNLKKEISAVFKGAAPEVARIVDPVQQFKAKIAETKKISAGLGGIEGGATVLDILKDISTLAPPSTEFQITTFNIDDNRLTIKGTAANFDAVDALKKELAKSKYLTSVQIGATSLAKQGDKVEFDLRMTAQR